MEKLVIDRKKWLRGQGAGTLLATENFLIDRGLDPEFLGYMCCLGFDCLRRGVPEVELQDRPMPRHVHLKSEQVELPSWLIGESGTVLQLSSTNDNPAISEEVRENMIKGYFASEGVEVEFIN